MNEELIIGSSEDMLSNATKIQKESTKSEDDKFWLLLLTALAFSEPDKK